MAGRGLSSQRSPPGAGETLVCGLRDSAYGLKSAMLAPLHGS